MGILQNSLISHAQLSPKCVHCKQNVHSEHCGSKKITCTSPNLRELNCTKLTWSKELLEDFDVLSTASGQRKNADKWPSCKKAETHRMANLPARRSQDQWAPCRPSDSLLAAWAAACFLLNWLAWRTAQSSCTGKHQIVSQKSVSYITSNTQLTVTIISEWNTFHQITSLIHCLCQMPISAGEEMG